MHFIMFRCGPRIPDLSKTFIMNGCWILSNAFFTGFLPGELVGLNQHLGNSCRFLSVSLSPPFSFLLPLSSTRGPSPSPWPRSSGLCHLSVPVSLPSLPHGDESGTRIPARVPNERCGFLSGVPGQAASQVRVPCSRCACRSVGASL